MNSKDAGKDLKSRGPDRRNGDDPNYHGPERRKGERRADAKTVKT